MSATATKDIKNPRQLYRDCLKLAEFVAVRQGNPVKVLKEQIRKAFGMNRNLTDPIAIDAAKEAAIRGLSNFYVLEAQEVLKKERAKGVVNTDTIYTPEKKPE